MRSAFNDACVTKIRLDAVGNKVETALMSHAQKIVWKREAIATELKIPARRPRPATLSVEQMAAVLKSLENPPSLPFRDNQEVCAHGLGHKPSSISIRQLRLIGTVA